MRPISPVCRSGPARPAMPPTIARSLPGPGLRLSMPQAEPAVAMVSGGDPGVFAMAAAVIEAIEAGPPEWRALDIEVVPASPPCSPWQRRQGRRWGHDFCAISLSDNLKPWELVERRLRLAAEAGFVDRALQPGLEGAAVAARHGVRSAARRAAGGNAGDVRPCGGARGRAAGGGAAQRGAIRHGGYVDLHHHRLGGDARGGAERLAASGLFAAEREGGGVRAPMVSSLPQWGSRCRARASGDPIGPLRADGGREG